MAAHNQRNAQHAPVNAFEEIAKLCRRDRDHAIGRPRPNEAAALELLREQAGTITLIRSPRTTGARPGKPFLMSEWPVSASTSRSTRTTRSHRSLRHRKSWLT